MALVEFSNIFHFYAELNADFSYIKSPKSIEKLGNVIKKLEVDRL